MTVATGTARTFGVGEVAADSGVAPSAVRFYENHGVINAVRTAGNQRRFDGSAACRIQVAKLAQRAGLSVREIAALFADLSADPTPDEWAGVANRLVTEVEERVRNLKAQLAAMESGTRLCEIGRDGPAR
ncbi:MerR family DNA-binding transcriptional regulator [Verrucosispora sp. WMMA2121]|uniref:MerR family DNA-binding transcriptional regulator n=1 Tax=Verrucosispora sp. WMMA2121 TaxID=3015164 RepID=UPI0022B63901|nr:MerR family DNA-binding transcriptional regulator [Verrucosispora sp. WMMA2121]MCZ7422982.1 MerR family DNA-binding transcriptional regulator [Verrucosispora sp. WMMA2121]